MTVGSAPRIDRDRLLGRLDALATVGADPGGGVTREAFGPADVAARELVAGWMDDAGLAPKIDAAANLVGHRTGRGDRWLSTGSHLDTVVGGGALDGAYGVVAGVEVACVLRDQGITLDHGLLVGAFSNEEGARGTSGMTGSHVCIGAIDEVPVTELDDEGVTVGERLAHAGGDPSALAGACWPLPDIDAFVELHIEQGPVLATAAVPVGAVSAITGRQALDLSVGGAANHAGTTPMELRHDALAAAAEVVLAVEALAQRDVVRVATCGYVMVAPNVRNVIPGAVELGIELRDDDVVRLDAATAEIDAVLDDVVARRKVTIARDWGQRVIPVRSAPAIVAAVVRAAESLQLSWLALPSGAGHDAQVLGRVVPCGMVFVPSRGGVSHAALEHTDPDHLVAGADVLLRTLLDLDGNRP